MSCSKFSVSKTTPYIIFMSFVAFAKLIAYSLYMHFSGNNTRARTSALTVSWSKEMLGVVGAHVHVEGSLPHLEPHRSYILISSHASLYDIPATFIAIQADVRMIGKKELFKIPFFGSGMRRHEFICIDRANRNQAIKDLEKAKECMESGIMIWTAAEGTRSRTGELLPFKKGVFMLALQAQAVIIPIYIQGTRDILPAKTWHFNTGRTVTVKIAPSIDTKGMSETDREALMNRVRSYMLAMKEKPVDDIDFEAL